MTRSVPTAPRHLPHPGPATSFALVVAVVAALLVAVGGRVEASPPASPRTAAAAVDQTGDETGDEVAVTEAPDLVWGLKRTWRIYVNGVGAATRGAGVVPGDTSTPAQYTWGFVAGGYDPLTRVTRLAYEGTVRWSKYPADQMTGFVPPPGYDGPSDVPLLDVTFSDPAIEIGPEGSTVTIGLVTRSAQTWELVDHGRVPVADLDVSATTPTVTDAPTTSWSGIPAAATEALGQAGLYTLGTALDDVELAYEGPGGAPDFSETWDEPGTDVLAVAGNTIVQRDGVVPTFWWVDQAAMLAHYSYRDGASYVYRAFDLTTLAPVGEPLVLAAADRVVGASAWDTTRDRVLYTTPGQSSASSWIAFDREAGRYVRGSLDGGLPRRGIYDPVRERVYVVDRVVPPGVDEADHDAHVWQLVTWQLDDDSVAAGPTYTLPSFEPGLNATGYAAVGSLAAPASAVTDDGDVVLLGAQRAVVDPESGEHTYPEMRTSGLYRLRLDDTTLTAVRTEVAGVESATNSFGTLPDLLLEGPAERFTVVNQTRNWVQEVDLGEGGEAGPQVQLPYVEVPTAFAYSVDQVDGTLWHGGRGSQTLTAVRDGRVVSSARFPQRSARGGLTVVGADHTVYAQSTDGTPDQVGSASAYGVAAFELVGTTPVVTAQPAPVSLTLAADEESRAVELSTAFEARPEAAVRWQVKRPGASRFTDVPDGAAPTLSVDVDRSLHGAQLRAVVSNAAGRLATDAVSVTVRSAPRIQTAPRAQSVAEGADASFDVLATGQPDPTVSWQRRVGGYWQDIAADDGNFTVSDTGLTVRTTNLEQSGSLFRARVANEVATTWTAPAALTVTPRATIPEGGLTLDGVTLEWTGSEELQARPPYGASNFFSAGVSDGRQATYAATDGDVAVRHRPTDGTDGSETTPTWATRGDHLDGAGAGREQVVRLSGGRAALDDDGSALVTWDGSWSVNFYDGRVPFTLSDPELTVDATGAATLSADLSGYGSSQAAPDDSAPVAPVDDVVVARFSDVVLDPDGTLQLSPAYAGVTVDVPAGHAAQDRSVTGWGAWPQEFVDFHLATGLSSYWYSSGGTADPKKAPAPVVVDLSTATEVGPEPEPTGVTRTVTVTVPVTGTVTGWSRQTASGTAHRANVTRTLTMTVGGRRYTATGDGRVYVTVHRSSTRVVTRTVTTGATASRTCTREDAAAAHACAQQWATESALRMGQANLAAYDAYLDDRQAVLALQDAQWLAARDARTVRIPSVSWERAHEQAYQHALYRIGQQARR